MAPNKKQLINCAVLCLLVKKKLLTSKRNYSKKRYWVKTPLLNRPRFDLENNLLKELLTIDGEFQNFTRVPYTKFLELHRKVCIQ